MYNVTQIIYNNALNLPGQQILFMHVIGLRLGPGQIFPPQ